MTIDLNLSLSSETQMEKHMNPLVIYHKNCNDGFAAAWCFWNVRTEWEMEFDFYGGIYGKDPFEEDLIFKNRVIYMVDFSYPKEIVEKMLEQCCLIYLIDHHKTAIEALAGIEHGHFIRFVDVNKSGAMLAWDFIHNWQGACEIFSESDPAYKKPPLLLNHIQDRDLWRFKLAGTKEIHQALGTVEQKFEVWDEILNPDNVGGQLATISTMKQIGEALLKQQEIQMASLRENVRWIVLFESLFDDVTSGKPWYIPAVNCPGWLASDFGNWMCENIQGFESAPNRPKVGISATYYDVAGGRKFSLRSIGDIDVSIIAKNYGGGGHKNAAGFFVKRGHYLAGDL